MTEPTPQQRRFLPSLTVLRSFECAARHGSFTLAAEELDLTQSAISRHIRELEMTIGADLFRRTGRQVQLTRTGETLAAELTVDLNRLRRTVVSAIAKGDTGAVIRLAVLPTFASRWLIPRLPAFYKAHPDVQLHLLGRVDSFDLAAERVDAAIHFGPARWPGGELTVLGGETMVPVAAPSFVAAHRLDGPDALLSAPRLHLDTRPEAWAEWFAHVGRPASAAPQGPRYDQFSMIIAAAVHGTGAALLPTHLIETEISDGRLVILDEHALTTDNQYHVVTPRGARNESVDAFVRWLTDTAAQALARP